MLAQPRTQTYAVNRGTAKALEAGDVVIARDAPSLADEEGSWTIEVWSYDPAPLSVDGVVDPLSLSLSLRDDPDERVQGALRRMVDGLPW